MPPYRLARARDNLAQNSQARERAEDEPVRRCVRGLSAGCVMVFSRIDRRQAILGLLAACAGAALPVDAPAARAPNIEKAYVAFFLGQHANSLGKRQRFEKVGNLERPLEPGNAIILDQLPVGDQGLELGDFLRSDFWGIAAAGNASFRSK